MPTVSYGDKVKNRTKRLLESLLSYANDELEDGDCLEIDIRWETEKELIIETKIRFVEALTAQDSHPGKLSGEQIKETLYRLKDLQILQDHRTSTVGSDKWHFSLKLWHNRFQKQANLERFELEWKKLKEAKRSKVGKPEESTSKTYNNLGVDQYLNAQVSEAVSNLKQALALEPNSAAAHYNLGVIYEDLRDFEGARAEYRQAILGGIAAAYNILGHLFILEQDYPGAVDLLLQGLKLASTKQEKYALYKNLGWARLEQGRYAEAEANLLEAVALESKQGAAHCLLAKIWENLGKLEQARKAWENCLCYSSSYQPDEDAWISLAHQRLAQSTTI